MDNVYCPYCDFDNAINHDDGYGYEENQIFEQECCSCLKIFTYTTSISYDYFVSKADCLNGGKHVLKKVCHMPRHWPDWVRCRDCEYEKKGEFDKGSIND